VTVAHDPCPHCGPTLTKPALKRGKGKDREVRWVECLACGARGPRTQGNEAPRKARLMWNQRWTHIGQVRDLVALSLDDG
jgi:hypothetical protein